MKKTIINYGLLSGVFIATMMGISVFLYSRYPQSNSSEIVGFTSMFLAFSLLFPANKSFRDKHNDGVLTFGQGFLLALGISFIASTIYVITWAFEFHFLYPDFMEKYIAQLVEKVKVSKMSPEKISVRLAELAEQRENYKKPWYFIMSTYAEIFPAGIVFSLISALVFRRSVKK